MISDLKDTLNLESIGIGDYYEAEGVGEGMIRDDPSESKTKLVEPFTQMQARRRARSVAWRVRGCAGLQRARRRGQTRRQQGGRRHGHLSWRAATRRRVWTKIAVPASLLSG